MERDITETVETALTGSRSVRGIADSTQRVANSLLFDSPLRPVKNFLNGTWLEHPLHPVLTDIPIGAWTVSILLDFMSLVSGNEDLGEASSAATGLGVAGALGSAATGVADWVDVDPPERAVGIIHAITNVMATLLFTISFLFRWADNWKTRPRSFIPALLGYGAVTVGGYLGGSLVFRQGVMINRNAYRSGPDDYVPVLDAVELVDNSPKRVEVKGNPVMLLRRGQMIYATGAVCSHYGGPLEEGKVVGECIECPWHASQFSLDDGSVRVGPATAPVPAYDVRVHNDRIEIKARTSKM